MQSLVPLIALLFATEVTAFAGNRYVEAGFPDADRKWTLTDYQVAGNALKSRKLPVPTLQDEEGAAIFKRMIDPEHFRFLSDETVPLESRSECASEVAHFVDDAVWPEYGIAVKKGDDLHQELTRIQCFSLRNGVYLQGIMRQQFSQGAKNPSVPKHAREMTEKFTQGIIDNLIQLLVMPKYGPALIMLGNNTRFDEADHALILETFQVTLPEISPLLSAKERSTLKEKMAKLLTTATPDDGRALTSCIALLDVSTRKP